ncbi:MAG: BTAD domain-containing putative transcriptional regulator [Ilumatobacteraceae bacterium]
MSAATTLEFRVLGQLEARRDGQPIDLGGPRGRTLLAALLAEPGIVYPIDRLIDAVWGTTDTDRQRALWTTISRLRSALEPDRPKRSDGTVLLTRPTGYLLNVSPERIDAFRFESLVEAGRSGLATNPEVAAAVLRDALDLWGGPPFAEFDHAAFAAPHVARLDELKLVATASRIDADLRCGRASELVPELEALVHEHPLREEFVAPLMVALYRSGRNADALRAFGAHRRNLIEQAGLDPSPVLVDLEAQILVDDPRLRPVRPALDATVRRTDNLRPEPNELVERPDIGNVGSKLQPNRVVTVLGPGGIGKSRCARAVARQARDGGIWNDGVWYVDLTTLPDADGSGIAAAVATVIGAGHQATVPSAADIGTYLEGRDVLVVLDNCEHVRAAVVAFLNAMFDNCSTAAVLATSRVRLGLAGERLIELPTLSGSEAVALFTARTAELGTGPFPAEDVEQLCVSLDNYPLALELAAARTRTHTPSEIVTRLDRHPSLAQHQVTTGTAPGQPAARHDSLDAALAWSLDQLDSSALATLQRSTVFADGFDLAAAEAVLPDGDGESVRLLDDLGVLVEHHLVARDQSSARFALLEPIRQTVLARAPTVERTRRRHAEHFLHAAADIGDGILGRDEARSWDQLRAERTHLREAVRWASEHGDVDAIEAAMQRMPLVVVNGGEFGPSAWADDALMTLEATTDEAPYMALTAASGHLSQLQLDDCDRTLEALVDAPDPRVQAISAYLASVRHPSEMIRFAGEMAAHAERADDDPLRVLAAGQGRRDDAFALADDYGNPTLRSLARFFSYVSMSPEERRHGAPVADECYVTAIASNNALVMSQGSALRGNAICRTGKGLARGAPLILDALEMVLRQRSQQMCWTLIESMAGMLAVMRREPTTSALLWAAVDATRYTPASRITRYPEYPAWVESQLAPSELAEARAQGSLLGLDAAARELRKAIERFVDS